VKPTVTKSEPNTLREQNF